MEKAASTLPAPVGSSTQSASRPRAAGPIVWCSLLAAATIAAYANVWDGPFLYDDHASITENPNIRHLWPPWRTVSVGDRGDITIAGRPVAAYTFALNYAISGLRIWSYRVTNVAIHVASALLLFGVLRRTLARLGNKHLTDAASLLSFGIALLWAVHPVHPASVTFVVQRVESLAGLLLLTTLYCSARGFRSAHPRGWYGAAIAASALGMGTKEIAVVGPILVLLYDRSFDSGSFAAALRQRTGLYCGLALTWLLLAAITAVSPRVSMAAQALEGGGPWEYLRIQAWAIVHYLSVSFWPAALALDYGGPATGACFATPPLQTLLNGAVVVALVIGTLLALRRAPAIGFLGAWFFLLLAPSSSVIPIPQEAVAEHRLYLPLAAVATLSVLALHAVGSRLRPVRRPAVLVLATALGAAAALGWLTYQRNALFADEVRLWRTDVAHRPDNARNRTSLGFALAERGRMTEAIECFQTSIEIAPRFAEAHHNLGAAYFRARRYAEAEAAYRRAIDLPPPSARSHFNLAEVLFAQGRASEAIAEYRAAADLSPQAYEPRAKLGALLYVEGRIDEAVAAFEAALRIRPHDAKLHNQTGIAYARLGRMDQAVAHFHAALAIDPAFPDARLNLERARGSDR